MKPLFVSIPHSGEKIPPEATWLTSLPEAIQMCDVDRFVDQLYESALVQLKIPFVKSQWHRYVIDLNRLPEDVDKNSVEDASSPAGTHTTGLHWVKTTKGDTLMLRPISRALHDQWVKDYFHPFHEQINHQYNYFRSQGFKKVYQIDAHSMPSKGTHAHKDPGQTRAQIVVSDQHGKSCEASFKDLVIEAYEKAGFQVAYNWPYVGGRVTQTYGHPERGQHCIQVEMNRFLYMDETTKQKKPEFMEKVSDQVTLALRYIEGNL